ncbi:uncharacterized protein LOC135480481 [Liolophura sinensis]|uniref:uncharacterized protein LOC135480481 n=1 Tax=Liolophura sinensis TaxID=3198878 RepID=UPI0031593DC0
MAVLDFLLTCFHGVVDGVKNFGLLIHTVALFNFHLLSSLFECMSIVVCTGSSILQETWFLIADILSNIGEFFLELVFCIRSFLMLLWKFILLLWHALTFVLSAVEFIALTLWSCLVLTVKTISQTLIDVAGSCGTTWLYGKGLVSGVFNNTVKGFAVLGESVETICLSTWNGVVGTIKHVSHSLVDFVFGKIRDLKNDARYVFLEVFPNIQKEAYIGVVVCLFFYLVLNNLPRMFRYMQSHGLTLPFVGGTRRMANIIVNDSDEEFLDSESDVSNENDDADSVMTRGGESDESGSDVNDSNDSNSNYDSDQEIDIQLPPMNPITRALSRCGLRQRTETPTLSAEEKASMSREDLELEVEREKDKRACVVCQDRQKSVLILPCRHLCLCLQCANQIARAHFIDNRVCPLCRTRIKTIMDIYV